MVRKAVTVDSRWPLSQRGARVTGIEITILRSRRGTLEVRRRIRVPKVTEIHFNKVI